MRTKAKGGQALMELAVGMFAIALIVTVLCAFAQYIAKSLEMENHIRSHTATYAAKIELERFAVEKVFGAQTLHIMEPHGPTDRSIPRSW